MKDVNNDYDDDNPFGDQNAVDTPPTERGDFSWYEDHLLLKKLSEVLT